MTRVRYKVVGLALLLAVITYIDRACIATLAPQISADLGLSKVQMGYVFSAFALAYAAFEIPTAWFADRTGTRVVLTRIVLWWSAFTALTGAATNYVMLVVTRFLFGAGEAGAWPCVARTWARWIPRRERGTIQGIFLASAHIAGGLTPLLVAGMLTLMSWRWVFVWFGLLGVVWAAVWFWWFRDEPEQHKEVGPEELQLIVAERGEEAHWAGKDYWRTLFRDRNVWALCGMYFPNSFAFYFCISWLPTYLKEVHGFQSTVLMVFSGLPLILCGIADFTGGVLVDRLTKRFGLRWGRTGLGFVAYLGAAVVLFLVPMVSSGPVAATLIAVSVASSLLSLSAAWGCAIEIGGRQAGVVSATMNTAGQIGSLLCPLLVAYALQWFQSWNVSLYTMAALFVAGAICWLLLDPRKRVYAAG